MAQASIGVIGGSGLYEMPGLTKMESISVATPFGDPSDAFKIGTLSGQRVAFLARHGQGHRLLPSELNYRANIYGFKSLGVERIISVSAVGSLKEEIAPLDVVIPDQFLDRTRGRISTFFGGGLVAHISFADPVCPALSEMVSHVAREVGAKVHRGGTYVCIEGPAFSTRAESNLYRSWGASVVGMTNLQEAKLAREAEICYATMAMTTDYDCWKEDEEAVSVEAVISRLQENADRARRTIAATVSRLTSPRGCDCATALSQAIISRPEALGPETRKRLALLLPKNFSGE